MKLIIAGSRDFNNYELLRAKLDHLLQNIQEPIVSGAARGADTLGEQYAAERGYNVKLFPADWNIGKSAGYLRNAQMADYATHCICFWDGISKGTGHMISLSQKKGLNLRIIKY